MNTPTKANTAAAVPLPATSTRRAPLTKAYSCSDASRSTCLDHCAFISPKEFVALLAQGTDALERSSVPILDCRSQMDFGCERIRSSHNINCRTKIMARKLASKRLEDVEPNLFSSLNKFDTVILYDQSSDVRTDEKSQSSPINLVVQAAQKSNKKVHIIQGGFDAVKTEYPHLIESPIAMYKDKTEQDASACPEVVDKENFLMTEILPHIFVGNACDAQSLDRLNQHGITHILNATPDLPCFWENKCEYLRIAVIDLPSQNIRKHFDAAYEFIDRALRSKGNNILVHCSAGISRSPTLVLAYMMKTYHMTLDEAFDKMRKLRCIVDPNVSFIIQLRDWEKSLLPNTETTEESGTNSCTNTRNASSNYCGSTSKSKTDSKTLSDSAIPVS